MESFSSFIAARKPKINPFLLISLLIIFSTYSHAVQLNEVMYDPYDENEWIEIYNPSNQSANLSGWTFADARNSDQIACCRILPTCSFIMPAQSYALLVDQDSTLFNILPSNVSFICVDDNSLGNGLSNTAENLTISNQTSNSTFSYTSVLGANGNNKTLERRQNGTWAEGLETNGTPGYQNSIWLSTPDPLTLEITEFLPSPFGDEDAPKPHGEWIELYNNGSRAVDLRSLELKDAQDDNELYISSTALYNASLLLAPKKYVVIYRDGDSDFALNDNGFEEIRLFHNLTLINSVSYSHSTEGMSWSKVDLQWVETPPTPGSPNIYTPECDWQLNLDTTPSIFNGEEFSFTVRISRIYGPAQNITVRGTIQDAFGNLIEEYKPWTTQPITSSSTKSYSPSLREGTYIISFAQQNQTCRDASPQNNNASAAVAINPLYQQNTSFLSIRKIYQGSDERTQWGDSIDVTIDAYRGDTGLATILVWAEKNGEKISDTAHISLAQQYKAYNLTIPIFTNPNCDKDFSDGGAQIVAQGLSLSDQEPIEMSREYSSDCEVPESSSDSSSDSSTSTSSTRTVVLRVPVFPLQLHTSTLEVQAQVVNSNSDSHYSLWGYIYRGSKCYSCHNSELEREAGAQRLDLKAKELQMVSLPLTIDSTTQPGNYSVKIRLLKDGLKTPKDWTSSIIYNPFNDSLEFLSDTSSQKQERVTTLTGTDSEQDNQDSLFSSSFPFSLNQSPKSQIDKNLGFTAYESNSRKASNMVSTILLIALTLCAITLGWEKTKK